MPMRYQIFSLLYTSSTLYNSESGHLGSQINGYYKVSENRNNNGI